MSQPWSRRALLKGLGAGAATLATAPVLLSASRAGAGIKTGAGTAATTLAGLHGATLLLSEFPSGTTWPEAISAWEKYTGTPVQVAKVYYRPGVFPVSIKYEIKTYIRKGIKALLSFKPAYDPPTRADLIALEKSLRMFVNAGLAASVTLWQEAQDHMTAAQYHRVVHYYGPTVRKYYELACDFAGSAGPKKWTSYYPGASSVDVVAVDYYANVYAKGIMLDTLAALADSASPPKPFGIWEMGSSTNTKSPAPSEVESYFGYIQSFMAGRLLAGKANSDIVWYNGNVANTISSSSDFRVPLWDSLVNATS